MAMKSKHAWAIVNRKNQPFVHSIRTTKREVKEYAINWCGSVRFWRETRKKWGHAIKKIRIEVE